MDIGITYGVARPPKEYLEKEKYYFKYLKACGWDCVNYSIDFTPYYEKWSEHKTKKYFTDIKKAAEEAGMYIGIIHGHGGGHPREVNFDYDEMIERCKFSIRASHYLGCKNMVMHPYQMPGRRYERLLETDFAKNVEFFGALREDLEKYDVYCCIENMWVVDPYYKNICATTCSRIDEINRMVDILGDDYYKICVDTGHGEVTQDDPVEMVRKAGDRLYALHCHSTDSCNDTHTFPFVPHDINKHAVQTDWEKLIEVLDEIDFKGALTFETSIPGPYEVNEAGMIWHAKVARYLANLSKTSKKG
ncbi:MAG: sugar phosphate isomerase/epimerase [Clostridia bacterium]|nr:sugar phosphate isomerase/epimerase [Clostridia bacterium]